MARVKAATQRMVMAAGRQPRCEEVAAACGFSIRRAASCAGSPWLLPSSRAEQPGYGMFVRVFVRVGR